MLKIFKVEHLSSATKCDQIRVNDCYEHELLFNKLAICWAITLRRGTIIMFLNLIQNVFVGMNPRINHFEYFCQQ
jgi:hypothetical protein